MTGSETRLLGFMEGADKRFVVPVYQRKYDWKQDNCAQLYEDLRKVVLEGRRSHFFGSVVYGIEGAGSKTNYQIIDGQQRLTTVSLLLLAMRDLIARGLVTVEDPRLAEQIEERFLVDKWAKEDERIKLRPVKSDRDALSRLFGPAEDFDPASNLTHNYLWFFNTLRTQDISLDELYAAVTKLEIIGISLEAGDNAQLIFESLNSTGLELSEGDKIRNYVLMGQPLREQDELYNRYWLPIERCTGGGVDAFARDYLSVKTRATPTVRAIYPAFKRYVEENSIEIEALLEDMLGYARLYEKFLSCSGGMGEPALDDCLYRLKWLDITVTRPYLMEVLRLGRSGQLSGRDVLRVFEIVESYLFRRSICEVPTNALNKIFLTLNREILNYDGTTENYVSKLGYALRAKRESGRFPDDAEFAAALAAKQVYLMRGRYREYLFERFENFGTVEVKDVYRLLANKTYTIEHIMPQTLTPAWLRELGPDAAQIHAAWLHRLGNLTLTAYNPGLSNNTFLEKRDDPNCGYRASGLRMNQRLAGLERWGLAEIEARSAAMVERAREIWALPETDFVPARREYDSFSLADEDADMTGRWVQRYSFSGAEQTVSSWAELFERVIRLLHSGSKSVLYSLAESNDADSVAVYVSSHADSFHSPIEIDSSLYVEKNNGTNTKLGILRRLFAIYGVEPDELVFYLHDMDSAQLAETARHETRRRYWEYALPSIQEANLRLGAFSGVNPTTSNSVYGGTGISGFYLKCAANRDMAQVQFYLSDVNEEKNRSAFDRLYARRREIEAALGQAPEWRRVAGQKTSVIGLSLSGVSIADESDWPAMAKFHAEWSARLAAAVLPQLEDVQGVDRRSREIAGALRVWAHGREGVGFDMARSNTTLTRFTTAGMTALFPDVPDAPSGWGTPNHYFYEINNRKGKVYIALAFSSKGLPSGQREKLQRLAGAPLSPGWQWKTLFRTGSVEVAEPMDEPALFAGLESCLEQVREYEAQAREILGAG